MPLTALADEVDDPSSSSVLITEVLTGTKTSGSQEFVELYNTTDQPIDLTGWQLWYLSAQAADANKPSTSGIIELGTESASSIAPHGYYLLSGRSDYLTTSAQQFYTGTMAATGGNLRLVSPNVDNPCLWDVQDQVGWGNALYPEGQASSAPPSGQSIGRSVDDNDRYNDTNNNANDFTTYTTPTPGAVNTHVQTTSPPITTTLPTVPIADCSVDPPGDDPTPSPIQQPGDGDEPPATVGGMGSDAPAENGGSNNSQNSIFPASDVGLVSPQITELLPNPASPQTDANDEFIELYNSNDVPFDLSGFQLEVGLTTKHRYAFPAGTILQPKSFTSFFSSDTGLAMSNSSGMVSLIDPYGNIINKTDQYGSAKDGQSWALANGVWGWSTAPTPNGANVILAPLAAKKKATATTATTTKKTTATKAKTAAVKTPKATKTTKYPAASTIPSNPSTTPIHIGMLAAVGGFALLYGAYEYRHDVANKFYQFRANRAARRATGAEPEGG